MKPNDFVFKWNSREKLTNTKQSDICTVYLILPQIYFLVIFIFSSYNFVIEADDSRIILEFQSHLSSMVRILIRQNYCKILGAD